MVHESKQMSAVKNPAKSDNQSDKIESSFEIIEGIMKQKHS